MPSASNILLYVADPKVSAAFYERVLGRSSVEASPTFALVPLGADLMLGLWKRDGVEPAPEGLPGGAEIGFKLADAEAVDAAFAAWRDKGAAIALPPTDLDFGRSFVALDPDGHRLRFYALGEAG